MRQAYELAAKEVNDKGGLNLGGEQVEVELIFEDSASRPEVGVSAAQKLLTRDQVDLLGTDTGCRLTYMDYQKVAEGCGVEKGGVVWVSAAKGVGIDRLADLVREWLTA